MRGRNREEGRAGLQQQASKQEQHSVSFTLDLQADEAIVVVRSYLFFHAWAV